MSMERNNNTALFNQAELSDVDQLQWSSVPVGAAKDYNYDPVQEFIWLQQIMEDGRLLQGLKLMAAEVAKLQMPYAPMLALHYQLGGRFTYPAPEERVHSMSQFAIFVHVFSMHQLTAVFSTFLLAGPVDLP
jgi:hypothetical protein